MTRPSSFRRIFLGSFAAVAVTGSLAVGTAAASPSVWHRIPATPQPKTKPASTKPSVTRPATTKPPTARPATTKPATSTRATAGSTSSRQAAGGQAPGQVGQTQRFTDASGHTTTRKVFRAADGTLTVVEHDLVTGGTSSRRYSSDGDPVGRPRYTGQPTPNRAAARSASQTASHTAQPATGATRTRAAGTASAPTVPHAFNQHYGVRNDGLGVVDCGPASVVHALQLEGFPVRGLDAGQSDPRRQVFTQTRQLMGKSSGTTAARHIVAGLTGNGMSQGRIAQLDGTRETLSALDRGATVIAFGDTYMNHRSDWRGRVWPTNASGSFGHWLTVTQESDGEFTVIDSNGMRGSESVHHNVPRQWVADFMNTMPGTAGGENVVIQPK